jgi:glycine/D-amino acid oxidase-like deaminating enzyme
VTAGAVASVPVNGDVSFWWASVGTPERRPPLPGSTSADVCIVGAGLTGLWTAYYLSVADPSLRIVVLEQEFAGYGASGRNGGWVTAALPGSRDRYAAAHGRPAVVSMQREFQDGVDEVIRVCRDEGIAADLVKGGELTVARSPAQEARLRAEVAEAHEWGDPDLRLLTAGETADRVRVAGASAGAWTPHCARMQPAKLVAGLADAVVRRGVTVHESTRVLQVRPGAAVTPHGTVTADVVLRATEGFTARLPGLRRSWLPMNSSMVATDPLPAEVWAGIGWHGAETLGDSAHAYFYAQRTADDRIAIGGRGVPYKFGSRTDADGRTPERTVAELRALIPRLFPAAGGVPLAHAWSGVLGVPRDWCATVGLDRRTGLGWAGGYTGHGVTSTNVAGRTLRDLVLGRDTALTRLPWVSRRVRQWEPEPLRWLGVRAMYVAYRAADRRELTSASPRTSRIAQAADVVSGKP